MAIRTKMLLLAAVMTAVTVVTLWFSLSSLQKLSRGLIELETATHALRDHMESDMMHDAIRGDVVYAIYSAETGNSDGISEARRDLGEHLANFHERFAGNQKLDLPEAVLRAMAAVKPDLLSYGEAAESIIGAAAIDAASAKGSLPTFMEKFGALEKSMGKVSDLIGDDVKSIEEKENALAAQARKIIMALSVITALLLIQLPVTMMLSVFRPLRQMTGVMGRLAQNDLTVEIPGQQRKDEIGEIARSVGVFKDNAVRVEQMSQERARQREQAAQERKGAMEHLAQEFEQKVKHVVDTVAAAATEMNATSQSVVHMAGDSARKLSELTMGIGGASSNVQAVAAATGQLSSSIQEISQQVSRAATITASAVKEAAQADQTAQNLVQAADRIGQVVDMINAIAGQINLLALNATIEAARAGEAGKGFAVVASEVKNLANETTKATEEITATIGSIQATTHGTVSAIKGIGSTINEINQIATTIAAAVEEQGMATQNIAHNVQQAAQATDHVSHNASSVTQASGETGEAAQEMLSATGELSRQSETLRGEVGRFLDSIRHA